MDQDPKPKTVVEFMLAWMEEPENKRRIDANDPWISREFDLAVHRFIRDHPQPPSAHKFIKRKADAEPKVGTSRFEQELNEIREAERALGWLSWPEWKEKGEGRLDRLHPVARDAFIQQYELDIADIVDGAVDPIQKWGLDRDAAIALIRKMAAPYVAAHEEFKRHPSKMPPIVEAHYRNLWPWLLASKVDPERPA